MNARPYFVVSPLMDIIAKCGAKLGAELPPGLDELWGGEELAWSLVRQ